MGFYEELYKNKQPSTTLQPTKTSFYEEAVSSIGKYEQQKRKLDLLEQQKAQKQPKSNLLFETAKSFVSGAKKLLFGEERTLNISKEIEDDVRKAKDQLEEQKRYLINSLAFGDRKEIYKKLEELKEAEDTYNQILAKKDDETGFFRRIIDKVFGIPSIQRKIQIAGELPDKYKGEYMLSALERQKTETLKEIVPFWKNIDKTINFVKKGKPLKDALRKYATNQPLTDEEKRMILTHRANSLKGTYLDSDLGSMVGDIVADMPRYMIEYALLTELGGGLLTSIPLVSKLSKSAEMTKLLSKTNFVMNPLTEKATFVSVPLIPKTFSYFVANNITQSIIKGLIGGTLNVPQIGSNLQNYMIPDFYELENEKKINVKKAIEILDKKSSFTDSLKKAYLSSAIEYATEGIGGIVEKPIDFLKTAILSRFINKTGLKTASSLSKFLAKAGWNGIIGEVFEEEISELLHSKMEKREYKNPFTTPEGRERLLVETLGIGAFSGLANVSEEVLRRLENRNQKEAKWDKIDAKVVEDNDKDLLKNVPDVVKEEIQKRIEEKKNEILTKEIEEKKELLPEQPQPEQEEKKEALPEEPKPIPEETEEVIKENIPEVKDIFPYQEIENIILNKTNLDIYKRYNEAKELLEKKLEPITDKIGELQGEYANNKDEKIKEQIKLLKSVVNKNLSELDKLFIEIIRHNIAGLGKEIKVVTRKNLSDVRGSREDKIIVKGHPEIYTDGFILLEDRTPEEVKEWNAKKKVFRSEIDYETVKRAYPKEKTKPVKFITFTKGPDNIPYAHLDVGNEFSTVINGEYYQWLKKQGYIIKSTGIPNKPLVLERNGKDVGLLMPIIEDEPKKVSELEKLKKIKEEAKLKETTEPKQEVEKKEEKQKATPKKTKEKVKSTITKLSPIRQIGNKKIKVFSAKKVYSKDNVHIGTYKGQPYTTDGIILELDDLGFSGLPDYLKNAIPEKDIESIFEKATKDAVPLSAPVKAGELSAGKTVVIFKAGDKDIPLDIKHYNYLAKKYKNLELKTNPNIKNNPISIFDNGELKGAVAPIKILPYDNLENLKPIRETQEIKSAKPGASVGTYNFELKSNLKKTTSEKPEEEAKPTIPKELKYLAREARKYKSAEEFIKAQEKKFANETLKSIRASGFEHVITPNKTLILYHKTTPLAAYNIERTGKFYAGSFFADSPEAAEALASVKKGGKKILEVEVDPIDIFFNEGTYEFEAEGELRRDADGVYRATERRLNEGMTVKELTDFYNQVMAEYNQKQTPEIKSPKPGASAGKYDLELKSNLKKVNDYVQNIQPIEMPELVDIAKNLSKKTPVIRRLRNALGRFYEEKGIALHPDIFKDTRLATRVLAHEIGHLVDYLPDNTLSRGNLLGRILTLKHFLKQSFSDEKGEIKNKTIREELTELSFAWRPLVSFSRGYLLYRRSSRELYADAISVLLNDPALLKEKASNFWKSFFDHLDKKPEVRDELFRIWNLLASGDEKVFEKRDKAIKQMFKKAGEQAKVHMALNEKNKKNILWQLANDFDKGLFLKGKFKGIKLSPEEDPYIAYDKLNFINAQTTGFVLDEVMPIDEELQKAKISRDDFGEYLMLNRAINERGEMANPLGFTKEVAQKQIEYLKAKLGEEKFNKMLEIHDKFRALGEKVLEYAKKNEVYSEELVDRLKLNKDYATFSVIDFLDGIYIPATVKEQKGTLREVANPYQATIVKYINVIKLSHLNKIRNTILSAYKKYFPDEIKPAKRRFNGKFMEVVKGENTIITLEKGDLAGYDAPEELVNIFKKNDYLGQIAFVNALSFLKNEVFSPLFIELSAGFQSFNVIRDFFRYYKALDTYNIFTALKYYVKAFPEAVKRGFGHYSKLETEMLKKGYLNTSYYDIADKDIPDEDYILEKNLNKLGISIIEDKKRPFFLNIIKPIRVFAKSVGSTIESLPKMAGYLAMEGKVNDEELGYIVRNYLGSPNFWKYGKGYRLYNSLFLYSNAFVGATLSDIDLAFKNPKTRAGWWTKTILLNIVPKIFVLMALAGWFGDKLRKLYEKIGDYSLTNYNVIPIGEDNKGRSVYITIPQDETGRIIGGLFYKTFKGSNLLEIPKEQLKYTWEQFPSVNPLIDIAINTGVYLSGQNPYDFFYGRNVLTEDEYKAGGKYSLIPFLKWVFIKAGGRTLIRLDLMEQGEPDNFYQKTIRIPIIGDIIGRFLRVSDKGTKEKLKKTVGEIEQKEAERRLIIKQDIKEIYEKVNKGANKINLLREEIQKMTKGLNKDKRKQLANYIIKKYKLYEHYKKDDVYIDEYLIAKTNEQKAVILYEMSRNKNKDEFLEIIRTLKREKLLSDNTLQLLKKMLR